MAASVRPSKPAGTSVLNKLSCGETVTVKRGVSKQDLRSGADVIQIREGTATCATILDIFYFVFCSYLRFLTFFFGQDSVQEEAGN